MPVNSPVTSSPADVAVVIVTFNRVELLNQLLLSAQAHIGDVGQIIVVDNGGDAQTGALLAQWEVTLGSQLMVEKLSKNLGGSGGFSAGIAVALERTSCSWFWLMDDDVEILPGALNGLLSWTGTYDCIHGRRFEADGQPFHWQPRFNEFLGLPLPVLGNAFQNGPSMSTNCGCFEGMLVSRQAVSEVGLPDVRFFITWDDALYGWLISKKFKVGLVNISSLRRLRAQRQISLGIRNLTDSNKLSKFYVMRNRYLLAAYWKKDLKYNHIGFSVGTFLTFLKEVVRLIAVERSLKSFPVLIEGWRVGKREAALGLFDDLALVVD